jgi:hypothetical protein
MSVVRYCVVLREAAMPVCAAHGHRLGLRYVPSLWLWDIAVLPQNRIAE